jgi:hypothetical protein
MNIDSARELKAEALASLGAFAFVATSARAVRESTIAALEFRGDVGIPSAALGIVAIGLAPISRSQALLAVRLRHVPTAAKWLERLKVQAAGELDVRPVGRIRSMARHPRARHWQRARLRPLEAGTSIGHHAVTCGTVGAFVRDSRDRLCVLSNNHVLANEDDAVVDDAILQPGSDDGGREQDRVASLLRWPRLRLRSANHIDAALGWVEEAQHIRGNVWHGIGRLSGLLSVAEVLRGPRPAVQKLGRTTGLTRGRITAVELDDVRIEYGKGELRFDNQIEIEGAGGLPFCEGGDSGSIVLAADRRVLGLLFAGSDEGGRNGRGLTYVNPINSVLDGLGASFDI